MATRIFETWYFVWWSEGNEFVAAFPNKDNAVEYANHMCWPGDHEIIPIKIKEAQSEPINIEKKIFLCENCGNESWRIYDAVNNLYSCELCGNTILGGDDEWQSIKK